MEAFDKIDEWIIQYGEGTLSPESREELTAWLEASPDHEKRFREMLCVWIRVSAAGKWHRLDLMQERVRKQVCLATRRRTRRLYIRYMQVASVIVGMLGIALVWQDVRKPEGGAVEVASVLKTESGSSRAILKLDSGESFELKEGVSRRMTTVTGVGVLQDSTGGVRFENVADEEKNVELGTIVVPERGEYFVVLSDGTKVWLNACSELTFPTRFSGDRREVMLKGEAYFEVVSDQQKPFLVKTEEGCVRVLGTAFNVMAYGEDKRVEVALLRGKVSFDVDDKACVLTPGEIATWQRENGEITVRKGDTEAIVDWTSGRFNFEDMPLEELVARLGRWYGITFEFVDEASKSLRFSGAVTKYRTLDYVLDMISKTTSVKFESRGDQIWVYTK